MRTLHYNWRDIVPSPAYGWSYRKLIIAFKGIAVSWLMYAVFTYASLLLTDTGRVFGFVALFRHFELFPYILPAEPGIAAWVLWMAGIAAASVPLMAAAVGIARITFEDLRGNVVYQTSEASGFARKQLPAALTALYISLLATVALSAVFPVAGLIGRIPGFGYIAVAIASLPMLMLSFIAVLAFIVFLAGCALVPAIAASTGEDALELLIQTVSCLFRETTRTILFEICAIAAGSLGFIALSVLTISAYHIMNVAIGMTMGIAYSGMLTISLYRLPYLMNSHVFVSTMTGLGDSIGIHYIIDTANAPATITIGGWILGAVSILAAALVMSYVFSVWQSSQVAVYLALRKHKNGDDLRLKKHVTEFVPEDIDPVVAAQP